MANMFLVLLVLGVVCVNCAVLKGKAFYCRDPETGKLHAVNTTWIASSFCGNYTCNLRKRNMTLTPGVPIREFNVTTITGHITNVTDNTVNITIEKKIQPDIQPVLHKNISPDPRNINHVETGKATTKINNVPPPKYYNKPENKPNGHNCKIHQNPTVTVENDRYLTEKEIDSIADLLHTVKKSDLDAIVDIYKLAQDIYKEMGEVTSEEINNEALNIMKEAEIHRNHGTKAPSYWYDPLAHKGRLSERLDVDVQNTLNTISTEKPSYVLPGYYNGLRNTNFEKTSFYYPVTQYQRISSYTHPSHTYKTTTPNNDVNKQLEVRQDGQRNKALNNKAESRKLIEPSHYLPYPFTNIHPYNLSESRNSYDGSPRIIDYYNRYKYYQPYYSAYLGPIQKAVLINPHLTNEVQDIEQHVLENSVIQEVAQRVIEHNKAISVEDKKMNAVNDKDVLDTLLKGHMTSNWKTGPIPIEDMKDIRADIDTSRILKAYPLRKKVKLERVGKVRNRDGLNSQLNRNKRNVPGNVQNENTTDPGEYETYLERVTCRDQVKLGYFRIGNLTQPYPECCPQLIGTR